VLAACTALTARLGRAINAVHPFNVRRRGPSGGELLIALAELMVVGGDHRCTWMSGARTRPEPS